MIAKTAFVLFFVGACAAYPAGDEQRPPSDAPVPAPQPLPAQAVPPQPIQEGPGPVALEGPGPVAPEGPAVTPLVLPQGPEGGNPENSDLKTDNSYWYRKSYYPVYRRSYYTSYYPRSYSYSYFPAYWSPYTYYW